MWICQYFIDSIDNNNLVKQIQGAFMSLNTISNLSPNLATTPKKQERKQNRKERENKTIGHGYI